MEPKEPMQNTAQINLIDSFSKEKKTSQLYVKESNVFCIANHLMEPGIIEHFIQSVNNIVEADFSIQEIKDFNICFLPKVGETLITKVETRRAQNNSANITVTTTIDDVVAAKCKLKINFSN
ncbi:MAG: hypothetical protein Q4B21_03070 [Bacteroidia bacterium]|nr:hypothetical protein [Bacteroidia bacterium]